MTENLRESFRIEPDRELEADLFHEGRVVPCTLHNLSAGGARVTSTLSMPPGTQCTLGVRLGGSLQTTAKTAYVSFLMEVVETASGSREAFEHRLRNTTGPGSPEYEAATRLVFEAQRRSQAKISGADESSSMASDRPRRRRLRPSFRSRLSKRSMRPDNRD